MTDESDLVRSSKKLSRILRHREDIPHTDEGWFQIDDVIRQSHMTLDEIVRIVERNTRYEFSEDGRMIRAHHGHSIDIRYENEVRPPALLYHGTTDEAFLKIQQCGAILPMRRTKVHLTDSIDVALSVASRHRGGSGLTVLAVDSRRMFDDGHTFFLTEDNVYLTDSVPVEYIMPVCTDRQRPAW